jgi:hypothetical protein
MPSVLGSGHPFDHFPGFPVRQKADIGGDQVRCETHGVMGIDDRQRVRTPGEVQADGAGLAPGGVEDVTGPA